MLNTNFLFASLVWGSIGMGYCIYGKKQRAWAPMLGGLFMMAMSYFAGSVLIMTLACIGIMVAVYLISRAGY